MIGGTQPFRYVPRIIPLISNSGTVVDQFRILKLTERRNQSTSVYLTNSKYDGSSFRFHNVRLYNRNEYDKIFCSVF